MRSEESDLPIVWRPLPARDAAGRPHGESWIPRPLADACGRRLRDFYYRRFARTVVRRHVHSRRHKHDDRRVLEQIIIPFILSRLDPQTVLDIGREPYEAFYNEFFTGRELWTIDIRAERTPYGAENHIVDNVANLRTHFPEDYFDFILMNGVFGWGLNERGDIERAFAAVHAILLPGGILVLGWNDTPDLVPVPLDRVETLKAFSACFFEPLETSAFRCSTCDHVYSFFSKKP